MIFSAKENTVIKSAVTFALPVYNDFEVNILRGTSERTTDVNSRFKLLQRRAQY